MRLVMDSRLESVAAAGHAVRGYAVMAGLDIIAAGDLELAMVEAANNIIIHGFGGATDKRYSVSIETRDGEVQVTLSDNGTTIPAALLAADPAAWSLDAEASRGLAIMRACADRLEYRRARGRNLLLLGKRLPAL